MERERKKNMKKLLICFLIAVASLLALCACQSSVDLDNGRGAPTGQTNGSKDTAPEQPAEYGGEPVEFISFSLSESGTPAETRVYQGYKTDSGVHLEFSVTTQMWDDEVHGSVETCLYTHAVDGDEALYRELCALFGNCRVDKWAGFHGENPPDVFDGTFMHFEAVLADGSRISADGSNNFPSNYGTFRNAVQKLTTEARIRSTEFCDSSYALTLPESWVGVVTASFSDFGVSFRVDTADGKGATFMIIDNSGYGYSPDSYPGRIEAGRLVSDGDVRFLTVRDQYELDTYCDAISEEARALWETYGQDKMAIVESIRGINGYTFCPEDGSALYESDAIQLADRARSLWLMFSFAGEYSGGVQPTIINGRSYKPMFPMYECVFTIDAVRERFLEVFSEAFTDRTISRAIEQGDLLEYEDDVYVAYKKNKGETSGNSWVSELREEGDGKYTVVMAVRMSSSDEIRYVELPVEKNAAGAFVFSDYPYWDESE